MARAPPDVPGVMGIFPTVAEMLFLEELEFHSFSLDSQIQWRLSPADGFSYVVKRDSSGWQTRIDLVVKTNKSLSSSGEV